MSEQTLALPLSGEEVIEAVVEKVRGLLRQDCFLSPVTAYEAVSGEIRVKLKMRDVGRIPEVEVVVPVRVGSVDPDNAAIDAVEATLYIEEQSPNQVRVEAGIDVPALVESEGGKKEIKGIKYAKKTEIVASNAKRSG